MSPQTADVVADLRRLADAATSQGRLRIQAICLLAIGRLEELDAIVLANHAARQLGGQKRAEVLKARRDEAASTG